jgi:hypothetical protein
MADLTTPMSIRVAATLSLVERSANAGATAEQLARVRDRHRDAGPEVLA